MLKDEDQKSDSSSSGQSIEDDSPILKPNMKSGAFTNIKPFVPNTSSKSPNKPIVSLISTKKSNDLQPSVNTNNSRKRMRDSDDEIKVKRVKTSENQESLKVKKINEEDKNELEDFGFPKPSSKITTYVRKVPFFEATKVHNTTCLVQMHSAFYETQREQYHSLRQASSTIFLRKFNNWVKSVLINHTCYIKGKGLSILDIC